MKKRGKKVAEKAEVQQVEAPPVEPPPVVPEPPPKRIDIAEQYTANVRAMRACPDCQRMAPRVCARHKLNLPI
jgi:hypothetical protein